MIEANDIWKFIYLYAIFHLVETLYKRSILYLILLINAAITCLIVIYAISSGIPPKTQKTSPNAVTAEDKFFTCISALGLLVSILLVRAAVRMGKIGYGVWKHGARFKISFRFRGRVAMWMGHIGRRGREDLGALGGGGR